MATLDSLKIALWQKPIIDKPTTKRPLSDTEYSAGFDILARGPTYRDFIVPQLTQLLSPLFSSRTYISVLEIGPGPKSMLGHLPGHQGQKIRRYAAFEPNGLFVTQLEEWLSSVDKAESPLPGLDSPADIRPVPFALDTSCGDEKFDVILFCHSMYGMDPKRRFIERALDMLVDWPLGSKVVVFHRDARFHHDGLVYHQTASFPTGVVCVPNKDETLDGFAPFIAGHSIPDSAEDKAIRVQWHKLCRALGHREEAQPGCLLFDTPTVMVSFTRGATALSELMVRVPSWEQGGKTVKNREARLHRPALIMRPTEIMHVQRCVWWANQHRVGLTVLGGGHSGHCLWPNVVSVDMGAFDQVHVLAAGEEGAAYGLGSCSLVVAGAGCKSGDIIRKAMAAGVTVSLGARPSVGAGLWLQGGIGHLAREHGLACDAIVGAMVVSVTTGQLLYVGCVPSQHRPEAAVRSDNEKDLLWAIRGAGSNFGIVVSVTFQAYAAPVYSVRNWVLPLSDRLEARRKLGEFDQRVARNLPRHCSADAYLFWDANRLHLSVTMFASSASGIPTPTSASTILGPEHSSQLVDSVGLFETEMYMCGMHGGHGGGKTSSFKRCLFLRDIGAVDIADILVAAVETRPSPLCYLHLLHGGGAVCDVPAEATAFGCRDWDFACVVTAVWPCDQDGTELARAAVRWYTELLRACCP